MAHLLAVVNRMKFDKSKYQILHLEWTNVGHRYKLGADFLENSPVERDLQVLVSSSSVCVSSVCPGTPEVTDPASWGASERPSQPVLAVIIPLYSVLVWPPLEYCVNLWASPLKKDVKVFQCAQRQAAK